VDEPIPVAAAADDDIPAAEVVAADDDIPSAEVVDDSGPVRSKRRTKSDPNGAKTSDTKIPRSKKAPPPDDDEPFAVPQSSSPRPKKKSRTGCIIGLGCGAFLGILLCGGGGFGAYYLWNQARNELAQATDPFGLGSSGPATIPAETRKSTEATPTTKPDKPRTKSVVELANELSNSDAAVRLESANALAEMEKKAAFATPQLAKAMRTDPDKDVRRAASRALKSIGATGDRRPRVEAFLHGLGDADETVRKTSKEGLDEVGKLDSRDQPVLLDALENSPSPVVQNAALDTLLKLDLTPEAAIATFLPLLKKKDAKDKELRVKAAEALGRTKVDKTKPERDKLYKELFDALGDDDPRVRAAAMKGLTGLGSKPDDLKNLRAKLHDKTVPLPIRVWACQSIGDMMPKPATVPQEVLDALAQGESDLKRAALETLTKLGNVDGTADALASALTDPDKAVRRQALAGLGNLGKQAATSTIKSKITKMMADPDPATRKEAAEVLRKIDPEELLRSYSRALLGGTPDQRKEAADAMRDLGPDAKSLLVDLRTVLGDTKLDTDVRFHVALAIVAIDPTLPDPVPALTVALKSNDPEKRRIAIEALAQIGPAAHDALDDLVTALKDPNVALKQASAKALARLAGDIRKQPKDKKDTIITTLIISMDDPKMHAPAGATLLEIGPECVPNLIKMIEDKNEAQKHPQTVLGVALVLKQFGPKNAADASKPLLNASYWTKDEAAKKVLVDASTALKMKP
jgi:HEAT repeat protein